MAQTREYIRTNVLTYVDIPIDNSAGTDIVVGTIYQRSTGFTWNGSAFAAGANTFTPTNITGEVWQTSFTANISDVYIVTFEDTTLAVKHYAILVAEGGAIPSAPSASGATQLTTLLDNSLRLVDHPITDTNARTRMTICINNALQEIYADMLASHYDLHMQASGTIATVTNQEYVALSSLAAGDVDKVMGVYQISDDIRLSQITRSNYTSKFADVTTESGNPEEYAIWNKRLYLYPRPSSVITLYIDYWKRVGNLSGTTDTPAFEAKYDALIYAKARFWWHSMLEPDDVAKANYLNQQYEILKGKMLQNAYPDREVISRSHNDPEVAEWDFVSPVGI